MNKEDLHFFTSAMLNEVVELFKNRKKNGFVGIVITFVEKFYTKIKQIQKTLDHVHILANYYELNFEKVTTTELNNYQEKGDL